MALMSVFKIRFLKNILVVSSLIAVGLPLFVILLIYPSFHALLTKNTEETAISIARYLSSEVIGNRDLVTRESLTDSILSDLRKSISYFGLMKLKIYSASGETIFTTAPQDIGTINKNRYFQNFVAKGKIYTKAVEKGDKSLENQIVTADVFEIYLPIIKNDKFSGAFEIYYDVTVKKKRLDQLLHASSLVLIFLAIGLEGIIIVALTRAGKNIVEREKAEKQRDKVIADLQKALSEVKTLRGFLPICSHCKKIRNDKGYWDQIEAYIEKHSEAEFSHGICPDCAKKYYPHYKISGD